MELQWSKVKRYFSLLVVACGCLPGTNSYAQQLEFSSSLNPVGSGARAMGMGGAFIGVADDATAASWNPAGLIQLEKPEMSFVYSYFYRHQDYHIDPANGSGAGNSMDASSVNFASIAYPFVLFDRNITLSLNYQRLYELNKDVALSIVSRDQNGTPTFDNALQFNQKGQLYAFSPAIAVQVVQGLCLGATFNFWEPIFGHNGWTTTQTTVTTPTQGSPAPPDLRVSRTFRERVDFSGFNVNAGFLWNMTSSLTLGGVVKTLFDAQLKSTLTSSSTVEFTGSGASTTTASGVNETQTLRMPLSWGLGLAYRHSDSLTVSLDVYRTLWSDMELITADGSRLNPFYNTPIDQGRLSDTTQVRLGTEYLFIDPKWVVPVRAGLFYDPEPGKGHVDDYYGIAVGTGFSHPRFSIDLAYNYRFGNNVSGDIAQTQDKATDVQQHSVLVSTIIYF
ncbi:MAG TPA: outer membrane protein transport protein [Geobacteraceae bacterium]